MKLKKFCLIIIFSIVIVLSGCSSNNKFNEDGLTFNYNDYLSVLEDKFYFKQLNENQKKIYMCLYDASTKFEHSFEYQLPFNENDHNIAFNAFVYDWPEYFWWSSLDNTIKEQLGKTTVTSVSDYLYVDSIKENYEEMISKINETINSIEGDNDYDKIKFLHDYMIDTYNYENDFFDNIDDSLYNSNNNIYKLLIDKVGTNKSYALLFSEFASKLGYECFYVAPKNDKTMCHNIININNNYYYVDIATDDCISESSDYNYDKYIYFLSSDEVELLTHINDEHFSFPNCTNNDLYLLNIPGRYFSKYDEEEIKDFIVDCIKKKNDEILLIFNNVDDSKNIYDYLFDDYGKGFIDLYSKKISNYYDLSYSYTRSDDYFYVIFTYKNKK